MVGEGLSLQTNGSVEARNRALFECVPDALFVIGSDGRIFDVNQAAIDQHGYSREELLAMHVDDLSAPDGAGNAQQSLRRAFELAAPVGGRGRGGRRWWRHVEGWRRYSGQPQAEPLRMEGHAHQPRQHRVQAGAVED